MGIFEWWAGLPPWLRYGVALLFLAITAGLWLFADRFWPAGLGIGVVLLLFASIGGSDWI